MNLRRTAKHAALRGMRAAGVYRFTRNSEARKHKLLILCYHGISLGDEHEWAGHLFVSPERFRQRLSILRDLRANVLPLPEALQRLESGALPPRSVVLTFDDGFYDFRVHAVPMLREFSFPCTLYWTTYYSERRLPIANLAIDYLLWKSGQPSIAFPEQGITTPLPCTNWMERAVVVSRIGEWFARNDVDTREKDAFVRQLAERYGIDYDEMLRSRILQILTPDEAAEIALAGIDLQLHTHRHRTPDNRDLFVREIEDNRKRISAVTGREPVHFCYPSGVTNPSFLPWLRECGVQSATTCVRGFATRGSELLMTPRVLDDSNMDPVEFEGIVSGLFA